VLVGPGGAGKGTVAARLVERDPMLWLSRSWTTRAPRPGEVERQAYVFVDRARFEQAIADGGFFEWAEFLGEFYGTPIPNPPPGADVLLEIEVQGAERVVAQRPDATVILLLPPSDQIQAERLAARGDAPDQVARRVAKGADEVRRIRLMAVQEVVNQDLEQAVAQVAGIVDATRAAISMADEQKDT
jgi:guanylate kinase